MSGSFQIDRLPGWVLSLSICISLIGCYCLVFADVGASDHVKPNAGGMRIAGTSADHQELAGFQDQKSDEAIEWKVISSGGNAGGTSTNFSVSGTVSQTAVGIGASDNYGISHGFWQRFDEGTCDCMPGDANGEAVYSIADAVYIINYIFKGGPGPTPYGVCSGDPNADCAVSVGDAVFLINYVFKGGPTPVTCDEWRSVCGPVLHQ